MPKKRKVLYINHTSAYSGAERVLLDWMTRLRGFGYSPVLACPPNGRFVTKARETGVPVISIAGGAVSRSAHPRNLGKFIYWQIVGTCQLIRLIMKYHIDIVHVNSFTAGLNSILAVRLTRRPMLCHIHTIMQPRWINRVGLSWLSFNTHKFICVSRSVQNNLVQMGVPPDKCEIVYNVIYADNVDNPGGSITAGNNLPRILGLSGQFLLVGIVGQIASWKGQEIFLKAARQVHESYPYVHFLIIGDILTEDALPYKESLIEYVQSNGMEDYVTFMGFWDDAVVLISQLDILVHASILPDPLPTVLIEGLVTGCCIIASRIGGAPEIIDDNYNGLLFEPGNVDELATKLMLLVSNPSLRSELRAAAHVTGQPFDFEENMQRLLSMYRGVTQ